MIRRKKRAGRSREERNGRRNGARERGVKSEKRIRRAWRAADDEGGGKERRRVERYGKAQVGRKELTSCPEFH